MKLRSMVAAAVSAVTLITVTSPPAEASSGPHLLRRLAVEQTQLLFRFYHGQPQSASPPGCNDSPENNSRYGVFLLPTLSFAGGNRYFNCTIRAAAVLVDLGGYIPIEDARHDTYTLADGTKLKFRKENLQRICDDVLGLFLPPHPAVHAPKATVDGHAITGTPLNTLIFSVKINPDANDPSHNPALTLPFYRDSVRLHHRGRLSACYAGRKALVPLSRGTHHIRVDLSAFIGSPTSLRYTITVV